MTPNPASGPTKSTRRGEWPHAHSRARRRTWAASRWLALIMGLLLAIPEPALAEFDGGMAAAKGALNFD